MFQSSALKGVDHPRRQLPEGLLPLLLDAYRAGRESFSVAICDQLAPTRRSNSRVLSYSSIPDCIRAVAFHCPPAEVESPVTTMAPDMADRHEHTVEKIGNQWRLAVDESASAWSGASFHGIDRNIFYRLLPTVDVVVRTESREPYANVILTVNPSKSSSLASIPKEFCAALAQEISLAGHSNAIVVAPSRFSDHLSAVSPSALSLQYPYSTDTVVARISEVWLPDTHVQNPEMPLQTPLGVFSPNESASLEDLIAPLSSAWRDRSRVSRLSREDWNEEIADQRVVASILCNGGQANGCYILKNWISGHDGGF